MPTPLIELQRRLTPVGAIRAGGEKQPNRPGAKLKSWRVTSPRQALIEQAASLYGGPVSSWEAPTGTEWQVYTEAEELPVLVMPGYSLRQSYELWEGATKRTRLCDGIDEELSGGACICNAEGVDACDIYTRLVVALPELDTVLGWRLITRGANAAHELPTIFSLLEARGSTSFVPARLRLDQRRGVDQKTGQVLRFVVPTLDLGVGYLALAQPAPDGQRVALPAADPPSGFVPAVRREATVEQALSGASPSPNRQGGRRAAPFGPDDVGFGATEATSSPPPSPPPEPPRPPAEPAPDAEAQTAKPTKAMNTKMDILVTRLREGGHIETKHLYDAVAAMRGLGGEELVLQLDGYDEDLVLHWSPLRESLIRPEATQLLDRLEALEQRIGAGGERTQAETTPDEGGGEDAPARPEPVPYNEFPPGY